MFLDTIDTEYDVHTENTVFGFAAKFGMACGVQVNEGPGSPYLFSPCWSSGTATVWMIESGFPTSRSVQTLQTFSFEAFFESRSGAYRIQSECFLPISPEVLFRYVLCRFLYKGDWKSAKALVQSQTSAGGTEGRLGEETYDLSPLLLSEENKSRFSTTSRSRCLILTLGLSMLQRDEWQIAWHTARKLCCGQSDAIRVELIDMFCKWLFLNNRVTELINFTFSEEVG